MMRGNKVMMSPALSTEFLFSFLLQQLCSTMPLLARLAVAAPREPENGARLAGMGSLAWLQTDAEGVAHPARGFPGLCHRGGAASRTG